MVGILGRYDHGRFNLLRLLRCASCRLLLPGVTRADIISRSERTHLPLNLSQMSSDTEDSDGLGTFALCKEITSFAKHRNNKTSKDRGREEDH